MSYVLIVICVLLTSSCNVLDKKLRSADTNLSILSVANGEANKAYALEVDTFRLEVIDRLERNDSIMVLFKQDLEGAGKSGNSYYKNEILELEEKNEKMRLQFENYKTDDERGWEKFKLDFRTELELLEYSFRALGVKKRIAL